MNGKATAAGRGSASGRLAAALLAVAALAACGGNSTGPDPVGRQVIGTQSGSVPSLAAVAHPVSSGSSGTIDVTLDWGNAANDFDIFITSNNCNTTSLGDLEAGAGNCSHITSAQSSNLKPERVTWAATGGTTYKIWVANFGLSTDSYTVTAGVTR